MIQVLDNKEIIRKKTRGLYFFANGRSTVQVGRMEKKFLQVHLMAFLRGLFRLDYIALIREKVVSACLEMPPFVFQESF